MNIQKLKQMISEPASKEWFAKHGTPKSKALHQTESPRAKQVRETNERISNENRKDIYRARHERRHGKGERTSKSEALERNKNFSKER